MRHLDRDQEPLCGIPLSVFGDQFTERGKFVV